ncbi:MAG: primosomal protein N' [Lautropia sp.]|nr:primosomal protein N' [Lautropia sp.]
MSLPYLQVLIDGPLAGSFSYRCPDEAADPTGHWVTVPWGKGRRTGLALQRHDTLSGGLSPDDIRPIEAIRHDLPPPSAAWLDFMRFVARYYHGSLADLAVGTLPKLLRTPPTSRSRKDARSRLADFTAAQPAHDAPETMPPPALNAEQQAVLVALQESAHNLRPWLLYGITGSGKTEVYLHWMAQRLAAHPQAQVLLMVPEIGLTPVLQTLLQRRFPGIPMAILHSDMGDAARAAHWLAAASGQARIILGTRLAVLVPMPHLDCIIVDEEHDPSYKQQEGLRYSARDMAVARAQKSNLPVLLGSATPSLESWHNAQQGRYRLLRLQHRAVRQAALPTIQMVNLKGTSTQEGLAPASLQAIQDTLTRGEQALLFLNRRGYAPVLGCDACGWLSRCDRCDAYRVLHRTSPARGQTSASHRAMPPDAARTRPPRYRLVCHHCAATQPVPRACPDCGNQDLAPLGRGTQKLEDALADLFPEARIGRLDRDVARRKGATQDFLDRVHAGQTNLLVGTQMLAKGHDFDRLTLVVVVDADAGLFTTDFRAPERLFATLMQVAGRAGRHRCEHARTLIQTRHPEHPLFEALRHHDYPGFAAAQLADRQAGALPPFSYQALLQAQARDLDSALAFLQDARHTLLTGCQRAADGSQHIITHHAFCSANVMQNHDGPGDRPPSAVPPLPAGVLMEICDPVPMPMAQINKVFRAQLLIESNHRASLHALLNAWQAALGSLDHASGVTGQAGHQIKGIRWQLVIDPQEI